MAITMRDFMSPVTACLAVADPVVAAAPPGL